MCVWQIQKNVDDLNDVVKDVKELVAAVAKTSGHSGGDVAAKAPAATRRKAASVSVAASSGGGGAGGGAPGPSLRKLTRSYSNVARMTAALDSAVRLAPSDIETVADDALAPETANGAPGNTTLYDVKVKVN